MEESCMLWGRSGEAAGKIPVCGKVGGGPAHLNREHVAHEEPDGWVLGDVAETFDVGLEEPAEPAAKEQLCDLR